MHRFARNEEIDLNELRTRLRKMSDEDLLRFGKAARQITTAGVRGSIAGGAERVATTAPRAVVEGDSSGILSSADFKRWIADVHIFQPDFLFWRPAHIDEMLENHHACPRPIERSDFVQELEVVPAPGLRTGILPLVPPLNLASFVLNPRAV